LCQFPEASIAASAILNEESTQGFPAAGSEQNHRLMHSVENCFSGLRFEFTRGGISFSLEFVQFLKQ